MTFYRVSYSQEGGSSGGYSWHTSHREAERAAAEAVKNNPDEYQGHAPPIDPVILTPTKQGILAALRTYASHEQNG